MKLAAIFSVLAILIDPPPKGGGGTSFKSTIPAHGVAPTEAGAAGTMFPIVFAREVADTARKCAKRDSKEMFFERGIDG